MRYGLFSDIHANYEAFAAVWNKLRREDLEAVVFLGDLVGYGADPKPCIHLLQEIRAEFLNTCVGGNHDYAICGLSGYQDFVSYAKQAVEWTKKQLDEANTEFLTSLRLVEKTPDFIAVHANLQSPQDWGYIFDIDDAFNTFKLMDRPLCFIGHSHVPITFVGGDNVDWQEGSQVRIAEGKKYIINIGSVGQPRDGNPKASYAIYDTSKKLVEIKRVEYDIEATQTKIIAAGLPAILSERLQLGK